METCLCRVCDSNKSHWISKFSLSAGPVLDGTPSTVHKNLWFRVMSNNTKSDFSKCDDNQIDAVVRYGLLDKVTSLFEEARDTWGESNECVLKILRDKMVDLSNSTEHSDDIQVKYLKLSARHYSRPVSLNG